jgi:gluconate 2-dehydrogenase gamma chain
LRWRLRKEEIPSPFASRHDRLTRPQIKSGGFARLDWFGTTIHLARGTKEVHADGKKASRPDIRSKTSREEFGMSDHDEARRAFLVGAAASAGALAGATLVPDAQAQSHAMPMATGTSATPQSEPGGAGDRAFLNADDAAAIAAFTERLMPGAPGKPGANDAGVLNYIDLALAGAYADLQDFYRRGLSQLGAYCRKTYNQPFERLAAAQQDEVLTALDEGKASGFSWPSAQAFFNTVRTHTIEGMFADPLYGGNKDFAGWRLIGFPGAQMFYSPQDMHSKQAFTRAPMIGLQAEAKSPRQKG